MRKIVQYLVLTKSTQQTKGLNSVAPKQARTKFKPIKVFTAKFKMKREE